MISSPKTSKGTVCESLLEQGDLDAAVLKTSEWVRDKPKEPTARALMFALLCYNGEWERSLQQLKVWAALSPQTILAIAGYERLVNLEIRRRAIFVGGEPLCVYGTISSPVQRQLEILRLCISGDFAAGAKLSKGIAAPELRGKLDGNKFLGLEDYDARFGLFLEVFLPEGYFLVSWNQVHSIAASVPKTHLNAIWRSVQIDLGNGPTAAYLPTRYPRTESEEDPLLRLARKTNCHESPPEFFMASGQHLFVTRDPSGNFDALSFSSLEIDPN